MSKQKSKLKSTPLLTDHDCLKYKQLVEDQKCVCDIFDSWYHQKKRGDNAILRIGGVAGTGKSALIKYLIDAYGFDASDCYVVAFTGQAVNVLRQKGIMAKTIHSSFMHGQDVPVYDKNHKPMFNRGIPIMRTKYVPIKRLPSSVKLIICDEASFLPEDLQDVIKAYNVPILETGDPIQLPPVTGRQCFNMNNLDYFMTEIMRQEANSEIIKLATAIRNYQPIDFTDYYQQVRFLTAKPTLNETFWRYRPFFKHADIIVTSTNKQRSEITDLYRSSIVGADSPFPMKGERMICRRNDWNLTLGPFPLTNGTIGTAINRVSRSMVDSTTGEYTMDFKPDFIDDDYFDNLTCDTKFLRMPFGNKDAEMSYYDRIKPAKKFEYAHAITCHLVQGYEAPNVLFMDSLGGRDPEYRMRIRYTAVTRARERLVYMIPYIRSHPGWSDLMIGGFKT